MINIDMNKVDLNNKTILVTGGCGFIGSNFIELINDMYEGMDIYNIDMMDIGSRKLIVKQSKNRYTFFKEDLNNIEECAFDEMIPKVDFIFHFAAQSHVDRSISGPSDFIRNNVMGITALLEWVRRWQSQARVINISTDEVYGTLDEYDDPFTEFTSLNPRSPYSASKAAADLVANSYAQTYGLDIITTRCCNNFGPNQHVEKLIPKIVTSIRDGIKVPVYGNGKNIREWIYVDDHNKSILEIAKIGTDGVYNIGGGREMSNFLLLLTIIDIIRPDRSFPSGADMLFEYVPDRQGHDFRYAIDSLRYPRNFEMMNFTDAIKSTVNFYLETK